MSIRKRFIRPLIIAALVAAVAGTSGISSAQGTQHLPIDKAVQTGDNAKRVLSRDYISDEIAQKIANACADLALAANGSVSAAPALVMPLLKRSIQIHPPGKT